MVRLAIAPDPALAISDVEIRRPGKSYSIDTLNGLHQAFPHDEFFFIVGSDSFLDIGSWRKYEAIFNLCNIVVVERPGAVVAALDAALPVAIAHEFCYYEAEKRLAHRSGYSARSRRIPFGSHARG